MAHRHQYRASLLLQDTTGLHASDNPQLVPISARMTPQQVLSVEQMRSYQQRSVRQLLHLSVVQTQPRIQLTSVQVLTRLSEQESLRSYILLFLRVENTARTFL